MNVLPHPQMHDYPKRLNTAMPEGEGPNEDSGDYEQLMINLKPS